MGKAVKFASSFAYYGGDDDSEAKTTPTSSEKGKKQEKESETQADVNVMCLELGQISQQGEAPITGDPVFCSNNDCKAIFNSFSKISDKDGDQEWKCEFCGTGNTVHLDEAELPKSSELDYILEPVINSTVSSDDSSMIIFCIDTSGSMCVTSEIEVKEVPKVDEKKKGLFSKFMEKGAPQRLPNEKKNVQYISRLQSVQTAVISQVEALYKSSPKKKIGIVSFNDDVKVLGDGTQAPLDIAGDKLDEYNELLTLGTNFSLESGLEKSKNKLVQRLQGLEEQGGTALGPALLVSCAIASKKPGSKVIICTDGLANIGLGSMDEETKNKEASISFYNELANFAKASGVTVSVITIAGNECSLENVGKVADITGGEVEIVDPTQIASNFASILQKPVIATNVQATLVAHPAISFYEGKSTVNKEIGNITIDSEVTFEFSVAAKQAAGMKSIPFQVQIGYRRPDGPLCVRVITVQQQLTDDRKLAEKDVDVLVIGVHVSKKSASLVQDGKYLEARENALAHKRMLQRAVHTKEQKALMVQFDESLDKAEEELAHANMAEKELDLDLDALETEEEVYRARSSARTDRTAAAMYQMKGSKAAGCVVQ